MHFITHDNLSVKKKYLTYFGKINYASILFNLPQNRINYLFSIKFVWLKISQSQLLFVMHKHCSPRV